MTLRNGRFGPYVQLGEPEGEREAEAHLDPQGARAEAEVTLEMALRLLSLPRLLGPHPEDGEPVEAGAVPLWSRGAPWQDLRQSADWQDALTVGMNRAVDLLAQKKANPGRGRGAAQQPLKRDLGEHPRAARSI